MMPTSNVDYQQVMHRFQEASELLDHIQTKVASLEFIEIAQTEQLQTISTATEEMRIVQESLRSIINSTQEAIHALGSAGQAVYGWMQSADIRSQEESIAALHNDVITCHTSLLDPILTIKGWLESDMHSLMRDLDTSRRENTMLKQRLAAIPQKTRDKYSHQ